MNRRDLRTWTSSGTGGGASTGSSQRTMRGSGRVRVIIRGSSLFVVVSSRGGCWRLVAEAGGDAIPRSEGAGGDEVEVAAGGEDGLDDLVDGVVDAADEIGRAHV